METQKNEDVDVVLFFIIQPLYFWVGREVDYMLTQLVDDHELPVMGFVMGILCILHSVVRSKLFHKKGTRVMLIALAIWYFPVLVISLIDIFDGSSGWILSDLGYWLLYIIATSFLTFSVYCFIEYRKDVLKKKSGQINI